MSTFWKVTIPVVVIIILIAAGIWFSVKNSNQPLTVTNEMASSTSSTPENPATSISSTDTSDAALQQDMTKIDTQMSGLNSDSASANQAMSATSTNQ